MGDSTVFQLSCLCVCVLTSPLPYVVGKIVPWCAKVGCVNVYSRQLLKHGRSAFAEMLKVSMTSIFSYDYPTSHSSTSRTIPLLVVFSFCHGTINLRPYREDECPKAGRGNGDQSKGAMGLVPEQELT